VTSQITPAPAPARHALRTLGAIDLTGPDGPHRAVLAQPKRLALLAYLAAAGETGVRRDRLVALFWPEHDAARARAALRQALRFLRATLGADVLRARGDDGVAVAPGALAYDVAAFDAAARAGARDDAVELYRGEFLAGFFVAGASPAFEQWVDDERARLRRAAVAAALAVAADAAADGRPADAARLARRAVAADPHDEGAHRRLVGLLAAAGDRAGALDAYDALARRLERDFGAAPAAETRALAEAVRAGEVPNESGGAGFGARGAWGRGAWGRDAPDRGARKRGARKRRAARRSPMPPVRAGGMMDVGGGAPSDLGTGHRRSRDARREARVATRPATRDARPAPVVAVLPFAYAGPDDEAFLGEGVADQIRESLHGAAGVRVAPRLTARLDADRAEDREALRARLGAAALLAGRVERDGPRVRLDARLVDAADGRVIWADTFRREVPDVFAVQDRCAAAVTAALRITLAAEPPDRPRRPTADLEAYNWYVRGRYHWGRRPRETAQAVACFERAVARDPTFAAAHAGLADAYNTLGSWEAAALPPWEAFPRAHAAASKALELDPAHAAAHTALGYAEAHYRWRLEAAGDELRRAVALDPGYAHAHHWHAHVLLACGQADDALAAGERAVACDPVDPVLAVHEAWHHWMARAPEAAVEAAARAAGLSAFDMWPGVFAGLALAQQGRWGDALASLRGAAPYAGDGPVLPAAVAWALAAAGDARAAAPPLAELTRAPRRGACSPTRWPWCTARSGTPTGPSTGSTAPTSSARRGSRTSPSSRASTRCAPTRGSRRCCARCAAPARARRRATRRTPPTDARRPTPADRRPPTDGGRPAAGGRRLVSLPNPQRTASVRRRPPLTAVAAPPAAHPRWRAWALVALTGPGGRGGVRPARLRASPRPPVPPPTSRRHSP
jgi:DNA-binding SARP family transcriptional activator/TolB-like protein